MSLRDALKTTLPHPVRGERCTKLEQLEQLHLTLSFLCFILFLIWQSPKANDGFLYCRWYFVECFSTFVKFCVHLNWRKANHLFQSQHELSHCVECSWVCGLFWWNIFVVDWLSSLCPYQPCAIVLQHCTETTKIGTLYLHSIDNRH